MYDRDRGYEDSRLRKNVQLNSCNSNSYNSKDHLNRTNYSVPSEFTSKPLQENSFNSNSHNSKNHLNRTDSWVPWTYFSSCNSNIAFKVGVLFIFRYSTIVNLNPEISIRMADTNKMAAKRKHNEVTLKVKYNALKELEKGRPKKDMATQFSIPGSRVPGRRKKRRSLKPHSHLRIFVRKGLR